MSEELAYSIHLGSDKNKTTKAKEIDIADISTLNIIFYPFV